MLELLAVQVAIRSLLPLISTVIEKVIHDQAQAFLDGNKILYRFQSGFRKRFSLESILVRYSLISRRHLTQLIKKFLSIK